MRARVGGAEGLLSPALNWVRQEFLGSYWGYDSFGGNPAEPSPLPGRAHLPLPYTGGVLSLDWGTDGALLPLRCHPTDDRVLLQVCGRRRILLIPPEHALPALAPFPVLHPYDGYSMPAVAHTLVYDTPGVDVARAAATVLSAWTGLEKVPGYVAVLDPGDGLFVPAGWFLHSELLPPPPPSQLPPQQCAVPRPGPGAPAPAAAATRWSSSLGVEPPSSEDHHHHHRRHSNSNIALVLSLTPRSFGSAAACAADDGRSEDDAVDTTTAATEGGEASEAAAHATSSEASAGRIASTPTPPQPQPQPHGVTVPCQCEGSDPVLAAVPAAAVRPRPLAPGTALLQLLRLLESWALAVEVPPGPELRRTLLELAAYHLARRRFEGRLKHAATQRLGRGQQQQQQQHLQEQVEEQLGQGPRAAGKEGEEAEDSRSAAEAAAESREADKQQQEVLREVQRQQRPLQQWLQLRLHPTFNGFTPRGRVLMELYDMVVRHVAPVARSVLTVTAATVAAASTTTALAASDIASPRVARHASAVKIGMDGGGGGDDGDGGEGEDDGVAALLRLVCEGRLLATDWVNQLCRDPEVAREQLLWYDDFRTTDETRFPELFRLQVAAKDAAARQTSIRPAALLHQSLLTAPPETGPRRERLPAAEG